MGHLRRPRIDVQIGGPFTQQLAASDTLAPTPYPYPEHKMKEEEEGDLAFPHKEDYSRCHLLDKLWEAPRAGNFNIKDIFGTKVLKSETDGQNLYGNNCQAIKVLNDFW